METWVGKADCWRGGRNVVEGGAGGCSAAAAPGIAVGEAGMCGGRGGHVRGVRRACAGGEADVRLVRGEGMADPPLETASAAGAHPSRPNLRGRVLSAPDGQARNQRNRACRLGISETGPADSESAKPGLQTRNQRNRACRLGISETGPAWPDRFRRGT
jgi:hypothetical protein